MHNTPKKLNTTIRAGKEQLIVCVLIAIAPTMYWETLELALLRYRPHLEVRITGPDDLEEEVTSFEPHNLVVEMPSREEFVEVRGEWDPYVGSV